MRTQRDVFIFQNRIAAFPNRDDVLRADGFGLRRHVNAQLLIRIKRERRRHRGAAVSCFKERRRILFFTLKKSVG